MMEKNNINQSLFDDKTLLITGGTGSFGNAIVKRFLETDISEIRIFSRDEKKQDDMRKLYNNPKLSFYLGDVRDFRSVDYALKNVDYVFHAAALKQVPSCEFYPLEAVKTNVLGAHNVIRASLKNGVKRLTLLSTDKAVYPINAMGMSKALMEKVFVAESRNLRILCGTRYGNVIASRGSVIPLFIEQVKNGKPLTITDPKMTRFMMSLEDAIDLVMFSFSEGNQGDIFVQKAPSASVIDIAQALIRLFKVKNEIIIIGTRHGEKIHETLVTREEMIRAQEYEKYFRIPADTRDLNYSKYVEIGEEKITGAFEYSSDRTTILSVSDIEQIFLRLNLIS